MLRRILKDNILTIKTKEIFKAEPCLPKIPPFRSKIILNTPLSAKPTPPPRLAREASRQIF